MRRTLPNNGRNSSMTSRLNDTRVSGAHVRGRSRQIAYGVFTAVAATLSVVGCNSNDLLDVQTPAAVPVSMIEDPKNAVLMVNSAVADFECALGSAIAVEAIISDEFADAQLGAAAWPYDRRDANTQTNGSYGTNACTSNQ